MTITHHKKEVNDIIKRLMYNENWAYCSGYIFEYIEENHLSLSQEEIKKLHNFLFDKIVIATVKDRLKTYH